MIPEKFRKMSTARLEQVMANGALVRDRKMATKVYAQRIDRKAAALGTRTDGVSVHIQIKGLVDGTVGELTAVLTRALNDALSRIKTPGS